MSGRPRSRGENLKSDICGDSQTAVRHMTLVTEYVDSKMCWKGNVFRNIWFEQALTDNIHPKKLIKPYTFHSRKKLNKKYFKKKLATSVYDCKKTRLASSKPIDT